MTGNVYIHGTTPSEQERLFVLNRMTNPAFLDFLEIPSKSYILEAGAGLGILAKTVAKKYQNSEVFTLDISQEQIKKHIKNSNNLFSLQGDAHFMPYKKNVFDVVYCRYLLEHVRYPLQVLKEIYYLIKPCGKFFIQENNIGIHTFYPECPCFEYVWKQFAQLQKLLGGDAEIGKRLYALLRQTGFGNIQISIQPEVHASNNKSFRDWVTNIIGNIHSAQRLLLEKELITRGDLNRALRELDTLLKRDDAAVYFYWNRAIAEK
jgi:ubiquinone/menaquinone biosynthesis C-methylase UbiE